MIYISKDFPDITTVRLCRRQVPSSRNGFVRESTSMGTLN